MKLVAASLLVIQLALLLQVQVVLEETVKVPDGAERPSPTGGKFKVKD